MDQNQLTDLHPSRLAIRGRIATVALVLAALALAGCGGNGGGEADSAASNLDPSPGRQIHLGGSPAAVAVGEGAVWVANQTRAGVSRLDPATGHVVGEPIRVGAGPAAIAVGGGAVYVACGDDSVWRIDPASGTAIRGEARIGDPAGIAYGEDGVWVTSASDGTISRLDPDSLASTGEPIAVGAQPGDVAVGDGRAWVADGREGTVSSIDAESGEVTSTIEAGEFGVFALALDDEGEVVAARSNDRLNRRIELVRIDAEGAELSGDPIAVPGAGIPIRLAAGEGALWLTIAGGPAPPDFQPHPGALAYLPEGASDLEPRRVELSPSPSAVAVGAGKVWVTTAQRGAVIPVETR